MSHAVALAVEIKELSFGFTPKRTSFGLEIDRLEIKKGERVALVGPSGSGKSTLLGLICGVLTPQKGVIRVLGQALTDLSAAKRDRFRAENLGIIFQQFNLLPFLPVIDNVMLALQFSGNKSMKTAEKHKRVSRLLQALDIDPGQTGKERVSGLSVGQQQRVAAARAFAGEAPLIIADEPTSALDEGRQTEFLKLLFQQADKTGATLLLVTHDPRVAAQFDRVLDLEQVCRVCNRKSAA